MKRLRRIGLIGLIGLIGPISELFAVPAAPDKSVFTQPDGTQITLGLQGDEFYHYLVNEQGEMVEKDADGFYRPVERISHETFIQRRKAAKARWMKSDRPRRELVYNPAPKGIVIVVSFSDLDCQPATTQESMSDMCNGDNYTFGGAYGSARKYFRDQSNGMYVPQFDVFGPIQLPRTMAYYGENDERGDDKRTAQAIIDACLIADTAYNVNFADYDSDDDGYVDFIYMIYAGYGENYAGSDPNTIWPHKWSVIGYTGWDDRVEIDGVALDTYACSAELYGLWGTDRCGIGTLCHEFSHVLGLPDYYDTQYGENYQNNLLPGSWDIMAGGSYNSNSKSPCNYSVHEKYQFGWATPQLLTGSQSVTLNPSSDYFYIALDGAPKTPTSPDTVYYLENRQQRSWDRGLPGHGLMVWRVVYDEQKWDANGPNDTPGEANYIYIPARGTYVGANGADPYPGTWGVTSWDIPNSLYALREIVEWTDGVIWMRFVEGCDGYTVQVDAPYVTYTASHAGTCFPANEPYVATVQVRKNYRLLGVEVKMGGQTLTQGTDYTFVNGVLTIPSLTANAEITVSTEKIPFHYDHCMFYYWHADSAVTGNNPILADINWSVSVDGSTYRGFDSPATNRGAQFGSRSTSPGNVVFHTDEMANCLITTVQIETCVAGETGLVEILVDDETLGVKQLESALEEYIFTNPEEWHGAVDIKFSNLQKALFVRKIAIHFMEETDNPNGVETIHASVPQGPVTGIYSITGQFMGCRVDNLPRGLFLVHHTDGTEKILVR